MEENLTAIKIVVQVLKDCYDNNREEFNSLIRDGALDDIIKLCEE